MHTPDDIECNPSTNVTLAEVIQRRCSRRELLSGAFAIGAAWSGAALLSACHGGGDEAREPSVFEPFPVPLAAPMLGFTPVGKSLADGIAVPAGYSAQVLYRLGDPINAAVADYRNDGSDVPSTFALRAGDHHDGMHFFGMAENGGFHARESDRGLLVMNHEAITPAYLHPTGQTIAAGARTVAEEVQREFYVHGVSIVEVQRTGNAWSVNRSGVYNRRIHTLTEMDLSGPAARHPSMITKYSPDGSKTRGTVNNCANGHTPWGTYLTCEENWAGYFRRISAVDNPNRSAKEQASFARYGVAGNGRELWATVTPDTPDNQYGRWNAMKLGSSTDGSDDFRNAAHTFGWVVEIDPFAPASTPRKRTALGRLAHEGAWLGPVVPGKPLVWYMGCDSRNEYVYKYVSNAAWDTKDAGRGMAAGDKYLDDGKLFVARFNADGSGQWLELRLGQNNITPANAAFSFVDAAEVLIHTRLAADAAGATKMDRPEWATVNPLNGEVYLTLTNNSQRTVATADAANPRVYNDVRTTGVNQRGNPNGHIIRWREAGGSADALSFAWDVFLFGARSTADAANVNLSGLTANNDFSSPDGLWFSRATGICWIETDDGAYTDVTNCMLLAAVPGSVGDGTRRTVTAADATSSKPVETPVGKTLGDAQLRRFLVGPKECEITGVAETPDGKALFVNIQHPGEDTVPDFANRVFGSNWPDGGQSRPRSATIVITRADGGKIGL